MKVCVIGAGPAGLCMLRQLAAFSPDFFEITAFEAKNSVGGKWALSEQPFDKSPLAESFLTELPKECLYFPEFPFRRDLQDSFLPKAAISEYFKSYASYFSLYKYVKVRKQLRSVKVFMFGLGGLGDNPVKLF